MKARFQVNREAIRGINICANHFIFFRLLENFFKSAENRAGLGFARGIIYAGFLRRGIRPCAVPDSVAGHTGAASCTNEPSQKPQNAVNPPNLSRGSPNWWMDDSLWAGVSANVERN